MNGDTKIDSNGFITVPIFFLLLITQVTTGAPIKRIVAPIIVQLYFFLALFYLPKTTLAQLKKIVKYFIVFSVFVLLLDTAYRFIFPNYDFEQFLNDSERGGADIRWIYMFKGKSLVYIDSNATALHAILVLFFTYYWGEIVNKKLRIWKYLLMLIIVLTFSRAAWFAVLVGLLYFHFFRNRSLKAKITILSIVGTILISFVIFYLVPKIQNDYSLKTKFEILDVATDYLESDHSVIRMIFTGVGMSMSRDVLGIYAHNYWLVWILETGFVVTILHAALWMFFIMKTNRRALIVLVPFFVASSSSNLTFAPVFYVIFGIMYCQTQNKLTLLNHENCRNTSISQ